MLQNIHACLAALYAVRVLRAVWPPSSYCCSQNLTLLWQLSTLSSSLQTAGSKQMYQKNVVQEIFPALAGTSDSDWQQVSKKKSREPFDPNAPSAGGAWARAAGTPTKPASSAAAPEPSATAATRQTDGPPSQERQNRSATPSLTVLLRLWAG